jgi:hypothetical protein
MVEPEGRRDDALTSHRGLCCKARLTKSTHGVVVRATLLQVVGIVLQQAPGMGGRETAEEWVLLAQEMLWTLLGFQILSARLKKWNRAHMERGIFEIAPMITSTIRSDAVQM